MLSLVYVSAAVHQLSQDDLAALLRAARKNNAREGISGLLVYLDGNFMQALEGPDSAVLKLADGISRDNRHQMVMKLYSQSITQRSFPEWSMAYRGNLDLPAEDRQACSDFLRRSFEARVVRSGSHDIPAAQRLLERFRSTMR